jgi:hypothetical protein
MHTARVARTPPKSCIISLMIKQTRIQANTANKRKRALMKESTHVVMHTISAIIIIIINQRCVCVLSFYYSAQFIIGSCIRNNIEISPCCCIHMPLPHNPPAAFSSSLHNLFSLFLAVLVQAATTITRLSKHCYACKLAHQSLQRTARYVNSTRLVTTSMLSSTTTATPTVMHTAGITAYYYRCYCMCLVHLVSTALRLCILCSVSTVMLPCCVCSCDIVQLPLLLLLLLCHVMACKLRCCVNHVSHH